MKNISISKMFIVIFMAFIISFFTSFSVTLNSINLPENASFKDLLDVLEVSLVSSLKPAISAILASILGYFTNNQKEVKE
jgi:hypothetical protein